MTTPQEQSHLSPEERAVKVEKITQAIIRLVILEERYAGNTGFKVSEELTQLSRDQIATYSDDLIQKIDATLSNISHPANGIFALAGKGKSEGYINTYLHFKEEANSHLFDASTGFTFTVEEAISGLDKYPQLQYENTPAYYQKAVALIGVIAAIQNNDQTEDERFIAYTTDPTEAHKFLANLRNSDLVDLIFEHPEQWEHIADLVVTRNTNDADFIRSIIDHDTSAIREGTL